MNVLIIILNFTGLLLGILNVILILYSVRKKRIIWQSAVFFTISILIVIFVFCANVSEYSKLNINLDKYEEYFELLIIPSIIIFFYSLVTEEEIFIRRKNETKLQEVLNERTLFIQELHHRIKNNIQVIISLLTLQMSKAGNPEILDALGTAVNRIGSIGLVENFMYNTNDLTEINLESCFREIISSLIEYFALDSELISVAISDTGITRNIDTAISCCIIINELASNVFAHTLNDHGGCEIRLELKEINEDEFEMIFSDNGQGFDECINGGNSPGLGLLIIDMILKDLKGVVEVNRSNGTEYTIKVHSRTKEEKRWKKDLTM